MLNLLPKDYKKVVRKEYIKRFSVVALSFFSFVCVVFGVAIFPTYTLINVQKDIIENELNTLKTSSVSKNKNTLLASIKDLQDKLKIISTVSGDKPTDSINKVLALRTGGVFFTGISYSKQDNGNKIISIEGVANSRASLVNFSNKVNDSDWVVSNSIPISNLASDHSIPFVINLTASSTRK